MVLGSQVLGERLPLGTAVLFPSLGVFSNIIVHFTSPGILLFILWGNFVLGSVPGIMTDAT